MFKALRRITLGDSSSGDSSSPSLHLHLRILEARYLIAADRNGLSDPFCVLKYPGAKDQKTEVHDKTLNPIFNADFTISVSEKDVQDGAQLSIELFDKDLIAIKSDSLGVLAVPIVAILNSAGSRWKGWIPVKEAKTSELGRGRVYIAAVMDKYRSEYKGKQEEFERYRSSLIYHYLSESAHSQAAESKEEAQTKPIDGVEELSEDRAESVRVFVGSWNVGNAAPPEVAELGKWLQPGFDIYAIGVQECKYEPKVKSPTAASAAACKDEDEDEDEQGTSSCGPVAPSSPSSPGSSALNTVMNKFVSGSGDWTRRLKEYFGSEFELVKKQSMMEIRLHVFARRSLAKRINGVLSSTEATGVGNVVGNKGGVGISLFLDDISLVFINSHLAAHQDKSARRNADVSEILRGLNLNPQAQRCDALHSFAHAVWMGDLNYRSNFGGLGSAHSPTPEQFQLYLKTIEAGNLKAILDEDQLREEMRAGRVFRGFTECPCDSFRPTFKVLRHTDKIQYKSQRAPAYCDRILYRSQSPFHSGLKFVSMNSAEEINTSDHKPVFSTFSLLSHHIPVSVDPRLGSLTVSLSSLRYTHQKLQVSIPHPNAVEGNQEATIPSTVLPSFLVNYQYPGNLFLRVQSTVLKEVYDSSQVKLNKEQLSFLASGLEGSVSGSPAISTGQLAQWDSLPALATRMNSIRRIRYEWLHFQLLDYDKTTMKEKLLGQSNLYFQTVLGDNSSSSPASIAKPFQLEMTLGNLLVGKLEGNVQLQWAAASFTPIPKDSLPAM